MKFSTKLKTAVLCSVFALATAGCDMNKSESKNPAPQAAATTAQPASQPASQATAPIPSAAASQPAEKEPDPRTFSNGERVGHVTKFSFKSSPIPKYMEGDLLETCKNWEGELSMENTVTNNTVANSGAQTGGNAFPFSVGKGRKDIVRKIQNALHNQHRVSLQYDQVVRHDECASRTDYYIVGVTDLEPKPPVQPANTTQPAAKAPAPKGP